MVTYRANVDGKYIETNSIIEMRKKIMRIAKPFGDYLIFKNNSKYACANIYNISHSAFRSQLPRHKGMVYADFLADKIYILDNDGSLGEWAWMERR